MGMAMRLAAALLIAMTGAAAAAPAMTFTLVRDGVGCEPDCPEWIAAQGEIKPGTARLFQAFLAKLDGRRRPLIINSGGGSVEDALEMGRLIRARGLAVAVGRTMIFTPPPAAPAISRGYASSYPAFCLSACTLVLAGGVERYASALAIVGVHEVKRKQTRVFVLRKYLVHYRMIDGRKVEISRQIVSESKNAVTSTDVDPAAVDAHIAIYFKQMGEERRLLDLMRSARPEQIHMMTPDEEKDTRLVTIRLDGAAVMTTKLPQNGLDGAPLDPTSRATLEAAQNWALDPTGEGDERRFAVHFALRRGGAGVAATFTVMDPSRLPIRYGVAPGSKAVRRAPSRDLRTVSLFMPDAVFCRDMQVGDLFVVRAGATPTQAPGLPDPRAPLLRTPFSDVAGLPALAQEVCVPARTQTPRARYVARARRRR